MKISPERAERMWRHCSEVAQAYFEAAQEMEKLAYRELQYAIAYRNMIPAERLKEIENEFIRSLN